MLLVQFGAAVVHGLLSQILSTEAIGAETTSCATDMAVKLSDLLKLEVTFDNLEVAPIPQILTQAGVMLSHAGSLS